MSEKLLIERLKSLAAEVHGPVKEALLDSAMALTEADALAARLAESEAECLEQARLNGMGSEREARLIVRLAEAEAKAERLSTAHGAIARCYAEAKARLAEAERDADLYYTAMEALRSMKMEHGLCQPRERMACTHCNAADRLDAMLAAYKGRRLVARERAADSAGEVQK